MLNFWFEKCIFEQKTRQILSKFWKMNRRKAQVSRITRAFSQAAEVDAQPRQHTPNCQSLVPGMSQYGDSQNVFEDSHVEHVGTEDFLDADEVPAATSQKPEFFVLSP